MLYLLCFKIDPLVILMHIVQYGNFNVNFVHYSSYLPTDIYEIIFLPFGS